MAGRSWRCINRPKRPTTCGRLWPKTGIAKGLVWHVAQHDYAASDGNQFLTKVIAGRKNLFGCWVILPPQTGEVITPDFFRRMQRSRIVALRAFPDHHRYLLNRAVFGAFMDEVSERRIPLLLSLEKRGITWPAVYQFLAEFPNVTCLLCNVGVWNADRYTWPLLDRYPNVRLETSLLALADGGFEATVARFGAGRLVFGSNFPERYPEASILSLAHAAIAPKEKQRIASANLEDLIRHIHL